MSKQKVVNRAPWLWSKEGDRESFFPLSPKGEIASETHHSDEPWLDEVSLDVISFSREDDFEVKAEPRESDVTMSKRIMADVGVKILGWPQNLKTVKTGDSSKASWMAKFGLKPSTAKSDDSENLSVTEGVWYYATPEDRMKPIPTQTRVWSGISLIRCLLSDAFEYQEPDAPFITGAVFSGTPTSVVVFMTCRPTGEFDGLQVVRLSELSEDAYASACMNYAQYMRLGSLSDERVKLFDGEQLLELIWQKQADAARPVRAYPCEPEILGIGQSKWLKASMYAAAACFAVNLVAGFTALALASVANSANTQLQTQVTQKKETLKQAIIARFGTLVEEGSIPVGNTIDQARAMYRDGMRIEIDSTRQKTTFRLSRRRIDEASQPAAMAELLQVNPPQDCQRTTPETTLQLNEVFVYVECPNLNSRITRILGGLV